MKRTLLIAVTLCLMGRASFAGVLYAFEDPQNEGGWRQWARTNAVTKPLAEDYFKVVMTRSHFFKFAEVDRVFGPKLARRPKDMALPVFAPNGRLLSGQTGINAKGRQIDLHAIGDVGYVEVISGNDGETVETVAFYSRLDDKFVPLKNPEDLLQRLEWDQSRFSAIKQWLNEHLPEIHDLGAVEVSTSSPAHISLGTGKGLITCRLKPWPGGEEMSVTLDSGSATQPDKWLATEPVPQPVVCFSAGDSFYCLTPKLAEK